VISELARFDFVFSGSPDAPVLFVEGPLGAVLLARVGNSCRPGPAVVATVPLTRAKPSGSAVTLMWRSRSSAARRRSRAASGSATRTAASTALMIRRLDQPRQFTIRAASDSSSWEMILLSMTSSVRMMINSTVRQSVQPSASNAAILGSRVSSVSACENMKLAARADRFIAAATSAAVR
jgi:hypothetical protein